MVREDSEHLGSFAELLDFVKRMDQELRSHENEKQGLRNVTGFTTAGIVIPEIRKRLDMIEVSGPETIEKQCIHIANYIFMLWWHARQLNE